jgi:hypothetical protein
MHGGASPGGPRGKANGNYKHGSFTAEAIALRQHMRIWIQDMGALAKAVE